MLRTISLLLVVLMLAGCRSAGPTVNPFGSSTVPAPSTGAIGAGANTAPYYPPNISPGQPSTVPNPGPYNYNNGQPQQWVPSGTGSLPPAAGQMQYAASQNQTQSEANGNYFDPRVQPASGSNSVSISAPITYPANNESAVQIPRDSSPLVTQRQVLPPVVDVARAPTQPNQQQASQYTPVSYDMSQGRVQTILPAQPSVTPVTAISGTQGQLLSSNAMTVPAQGMPANRVYKGARTGTIVPQPIPNQVQIPGQYAVQPALATSYATTRSGATLRTGPTLASAAPAGIRDMPAVNFDELPRVQR